MISGMDLVKEAPHKTDGDELAAIVDAKRGILNELRDQRYRAENEVNRLNTLIATNEMLVDALSQLAERCYIMDREHQDFLKRNEPVAAPFPRPF